MIILGDLLGLQIDPNWDDLIKLIFRFLLNLFTAIIVIKVVYMHLYKNRIYSFTFFMFNIVTFCLCILLRKVPAELGFALAIFAVFGVLRYRTEQIKIINLTYLFIVIGIGIVNAIANKKISFPELLFVNAVIAGSTLLLERLTFSKRVFSVPMFYDRMDLLKPGMEEELHKDIINKTGLDLLNVEVVYIDSLRDSAEIQINYKKLK